LNRLDPALKRLMRWAGQAPPADVPEAPFGFSTRVVARWEPGRTNVPVGGCPRAVAFSAWVSTAIILGGLGFYLQQRHRAETAYDFPSAYLVAAQSIVP
jgi:hypothetical protein